MRVLECFSRHNYRSNDPFESNTTKRVAYLGTPGTWLNIPDFGLTEAASNLPIIGGLFQNSTFQNPLVSKAFAADTTNPVTQGVQGDSTGPVQGPIYNGPVQGPAPTPQPTQQTNLDPGQQQLTDAQNSWKSDISNSWDQYLNSLNGMSGEFNNQKTAQEGIANTQLKAGQDTATTQKAKSLRDISTNVKNAFQAGNQYLGVRGAGDSSASNQYSFAVQQDANKQIGQLNEFVNTQMQQLQSTHDTQINSIAQWFSQQQQQLQQLIANGQLSKSQDINNASKSILDQALQATQQAKTDTTNRTNALVQWAANNSTNLQQLSQNIAGIPQALGQMTVDSTGNIAQAPMGYGYGQDNTQKVPTGYGATNSSVSNPLFSQMTLDQQNQLLGQPTWGQ